MENWYIPIRLALIRSLFKKRRGSAVKSVITVVATIFAGALIIGLLAVELVNSKDTVAEAAGNASDTSTDYNDTIDNVLDNAWLVMGFIVLGLLLFGIRYLLIQIGYL